MASFGVHIKNMDNEFRKIDTNRGGFILFDEFVNYCIKISLSLETDDDDWINDYYIIKYTIFISFFIFYFLIF